MATLAMTFKNLRDRVLALYTSPTADQITEAGQYVNDGYLRVMSDYLWSCALKDATLSMTVAGAGVVALPSDFASRVTDPVLSSISTSPRLKQRTATWIAQRVQESSSTTGQPEYYAIRPKAFTAATGQQWEMVVYPLPDTTYTAIMPYRFEVLALSADGDYPMGGSALSLAILAASLMMYEEAKGETDGIHHRLYLGDGRGPGALGRAIAADAANRAAILGSMTLDEYPATTPNSVTYGGVL